MVPWCLTFYFFYCLFTELYWCLHGQPIPSAWQNGHDKYSSEKTVPLIFMSINGQYSKVFCEIIRSVPLLQYLFVLWTFSYPLISSNDFASPKPSIPNSKLNRSDDITFWTVLSFSVTHALIKAVYCLSHGSIQVLSACASPSVAYVIAWLMHQNWFLVDSINILCNLSLVQDELWRSASRFSGITSLWKFFITSFWCLM